MTEKAFLKLCDGESHFAGEDFEVWVRGGRLDGARPVVAIDLQGSGILLTSAPSDATEGLQICTMKELLRCLHKGIEMLGGVESESCCCVCCPEPSGDYRYYDVGDECPATLIADERVLFALGTER